MHQKKTTFLAAGITLFVIASLVFVFWLSSLHANDRPSIVVPDPSYTGADNHLTPVLLNNPDDYLHFALSTENLCDLLRTLKTPDTYRITFTAAVYAGAKQTNTDVTLCRRQNLLHIYRSDSILPTEYLLAGDTLYGWLSGQKTYRSFPLGSFDPAWLAKLPSLQTLSALDASRFEAAEFVEQDGMWTIRIAYATRRGLSEVCYVSLDSGLVIQSETYDHGTLIFSLQVSDLSLDEPDSSVFLLPDGTTPQ